jgi:cytoskeletal protein RodZ
VTAQQRAFGDKLRAAREQRGVTIDSIAHATKIAGSLFVSLERGDCSRWPSGVYSRAYVRSYAAAVGLDPSATAEEFGHCFPAVAWPDGAPDPTPAADPHAASESALRLTLDPMPSDRWRWLRSGAADRLALCGASVLVAVAASLLGMDFWMALSAATLAVQARHLV